jgi:molybdopterin/thiamine biosynthesis adenylyltransferase
MLVFQLAKIAELGQPLTAGIYTIPVRLIDNSDCLSTVALPGIEPSQPSGPLISVTLIAVEQSLSLSEPGRAIASIMADLKRTADGPERSGLFSENSRAEKIAHLALLRYDRVEIPSKTNYWIVRRELRREGVDICIDGSTFVIGSSERMLEGVRGPVPVNLVSRFDTLSERDGLLIDRETLRNRSVLVIGLGSIGSVLASDLARSGVGRFVVADSERLEWGNVVRHAAGLSDVGRLKSKVARDLILDRNPESQVLEISQGLESNSLATYDKAVESVDVVVCATDNRVSRLLCNRMCVKHRKKVIFGGLTSGAYGGMVFQFQPPESMCYHCFVTGFPDAAADRETDESEYAGGPDGHLALDIAPITNLMSKLVIVELQKQTGKVPSGLDVDLSAPWYIWINRREGEYAELAPLGSAAGRLRVLQWNPVPMEKVEECPHCGRVAR